MADNEYYVYKLIDPRTKFTFYIGKGKGDRIYAHVKAAIKNYNGKDYTNTDSNGVIEDEANSKIALIREIIADGYEVEMMIIRNGLDEKTAYEVEAALIDTTPGLTNMKKGHGTAKGPIIIAQNGSTLTKKPIYVKPPPTSVPDQSLFKQKIEEIIKNGSISINDNIQFRQIIDIINHLFGKEIRGWMRAIYPINRYNKLWFPKFNETNKKYKPNPKTFGHVTSACWSNFLSSDGTTITQKWIATDYLPPSEPFDKSKKHEIEYLGVFAKIIRGDYKFAGIFQLDPENSHEYTTIHKRIATELPFCEWK